MEVRPLFDRIVVKRLVPESVTKSGLFMPGATEQKLGEARVVAVGQGKLLENGELRAPAVKVGDIVIFGKFAGTEIKIDDVEHLVLREDEVFGVLEG